MASQSRGVVLRAYENDKDAQIVKMLVGQGVMEGLASSNRRFFWSPPILLIWLLLALVIDYHLAHLPTPSYLLGPGPLLPKAQCLIGFGAAALPLLGIAEWFHRPVFTRLLRQTLGAPDMVDVGKYYAMSSKSGCWVLTRNFRLGREGGPASGEREERKDEVVGVVMMDAHRPGEDLGTVLGPEEKRFGGEGVLEKAGMAKSARAKGARGKVAAAEATTQTGRIAQIRHLDVDHPVRRKGVATELLIRALDHAFDTAPSSDGGEKAEESELSHAGEESDRIERVIVRTSPFTPGDKALWLKFGFVPSDSGAIAGNGESRAEPERIGLLGWQVAWMSLDRESWTMRRKELVE